mmetsp:Transcript_2937/g.5068  ORF Transcript_2937/g.5068 Transcript_2937/m.5068 type:complete len:229 (-) Transcript_2937:175-861(-)
MKMMTNTLLLFLIFLLSGSHGADFNAPHKHSGLLKPYAVEKPSVQLDSKQKDALLAGKNVKEQLLQGDGGRAMVIQDVHAPPTVVWDRILDFGSYNRMVPKVKTCENYDVTEEEDGSQKIMTRMCLGVFGVKIEYFIEHCISTLENGQKICTWTLDYNKSSDLDESVGYWYVEPHPDPEKPDWSRVFYSVALVPPGWIPGIVKNFLTKQALTQATAWVKEHSEKQHNA